MRVDDFRSITADLESVYSKKLTAAQIQMWYEELKNYSTERYKRAIHKIYTTNQYFPTLSVVLDTIKTMRTEQINQEKVECKACKGTGYVLYHKIVNGISYEYAALCNCANANGKEYDGTKNKENKSDYYLEQATKVFGIGG